MGRMVEVICAGCGKGFQKCIGHVNASKTGRFFCTRQCSAKAQVIRVTCTCEQCGEQFETQPSEVRKYCTHGCFFEACRGQERPIMQGRTPWNGGRMPSESILRDLYETQELTPNEIGARFDVQGQTVCNWLHSYEIPVRQSQTRFKRGFAPANKLPTLDKETLQYLYHDCQLTTQQIAEHYAVSSGLVGNWLKRHHIERRAAGIGLTSRGIEAPTDAELQNMIHVQRLSYREIAEQYGVDQSAVPYWLDARGIARAQSWYDRHNNADSLAELCAMYDAGYSLDHIAERDGITKTQLTKLFKDNEITIRKDGWQGGKRFETIDGNLVRSTYERTVANWLYEQGMDYIYEPALPFSNVWRADFLANGWYIEVWGVTNSPSYKARQIAKQAAYKANGVPLIDLPVHSFAPSRNGLWERKLIQHLHL